MKGLELSKQFYLSHGKPMLKRDFPTLLPCLAVGLAGAGSECFGYDDEISRDHDFEPGFCIFLPDESVVDSRAAFALERAYAKLPKEFMGFTRSPLSPVGGSRHGVLRMSDFFEQKTGEPQGELSLFDWFSIPEQSLSEATNGEVFFDGLGTFTEIRRRLSYLPEDVRRKKLAGHIFLLGQAGKYNYERCVERADSAAAQLSVFEFAKSALHSAFLLNKRYLPYYKWQFRALRELPSLFEIEDPLSLLLTGGNSADEFKKKRAEIDAVFSHIAASLSSLGITVRPDMTAEALAYAVNETVSNNRLRNTHLLFGV